MKVRKQLKVSGAIIRPEDVRRLANRIYDEYRQSASDSQRTSIEFIMRGADNTQYENDKPDIFLEDGILHSRRIISIEINYFNYSQNRSIFTKLTHFDYPQELFDNNRININGEELWASGFTDVLRDIISSWERQPRWPASLLLYIFTGVVVIASTIFTSTLITSAPLINRLILNSFLTLIIIISLSKKITKLVYSMYPYVSLITGPEYSREGERKRKLLNQFILVIAIPVLLSLLPKLLSFFKGS